MPSRPSQGRRQRCPLGEPQLVTGRQRATRAAAFEADQKKGRASLGDLSLAPRTGYGPSPRWDSRRGHLSSCGAPSPTLRRAAFFGADVKMAASCEARPVHLLTVMGQPQSLLVNPRLPRRAGEAGNPTLRAAQDRPTFAARHSSARCAAVSSRRDWRPARRAR